MRNKPILAVFVIALLAAASALPAHAAELTIGGAAQYQWWHPAWNNGKMVITSPEQISIVDNFAPRFPELRQFMYGPFLSVRFMRAWELTAGFLYGRASAAAGSPGLMPKLVIRNMDVSVKRYDISASAGYYLADYIKVFIGLRMDLLDASTNYKHAQFQGQFEVFYSKIEGTTLNFTPELGARLSMPLSAIFRLVYDLSCAFQSGSEKIEFKKSFNQNGPELTTIKYPQARYYAAGMNTSLLLAVDVPKTGLTLAIGGSYRLLAYFQKKSDRGIRVLNGYLDHDIRPVISASYRFPLEETKKQNIWIPRPEMGE